MWRNIAEPDRLQLTMWHMRIANWIPKVTNKYSEYVILFQYNNGCTHSPQYHAIRVLPVLLIILIAEELLDSEEGLRFVELVKGFHSCIATTCVKSIKFLCSLCVEAWEKLIMNNQFQIQYLERRNYSEDPGEYVRKYVKINV